MERGFILMKSPDIKDEMNAREVIIVSLEHEGRNKHVIM